MREISSDTRWHIAARSASSLPVLYAVVFRGRMGEECDHLVEEVWCQVGGEVQEIAKGLNLPVTPAERLAASLLEIARTLFGPEFRGEILDLSPDRAVILMNRCPFLIRTREMGVNSSVVFNPCLAFCISATETLHKDYSVRFIRAMCMGDRNCEIRMARKDLLEKDTDLAA
ncbi:MAG: hypothetical protein LUP99_05345 [Methanomicrobiales archaeon]|nr:hypothetical protein [Methanomicrobiales archaeon]